MKILLLLPFISSSLGAVVQDPLAFVDLFIGTRNGGHVFPGATLPHGMVKAGMDTDAPGNHAGYDASPEYNVTGFSALHDSGTGGAVPLSNFKLFPLVSCDGGFEGCKTRLGSRRILRHILPDGLPDDTASPGYFATNLSSGVRVELTATRRAALHRYTFPANASHPRLLVDLANDGQMSSTKPEMQIDPRSGRVSGGASFAASFGPGRYRAYTCVDFKHPLSAQDAAPTEYGAWLYDFPVRGTTRASQMYFGFVSELGALLTFPPAPSGGQTEVLARVGVSLISAAQACANAEAEIPDFDFARVQSAARDQWREVLGRVRVDTKGVEEETVRLFYSSLYRTHISPADYTGENPHWNSTEPYFDSLYCNWDTYRTLYPLFSLHSPEILARVVRGMVDVQKHEGWLPECRGASAQHFIQGGSNGDPILSELAVKYAAHLSALNVSAPALYAALVADAEVQPPDWDLQGRQVDVWKKLGYVPQDVQEEGGTNSKQVSRTLEYAFDDFVIAQVAKALNNTDDAAKYYRRAANFANVWNPKIPDVSGAPQSLHGMMQPRFANGSFGYTEPRRCSGANDPAQATCYLNAANHDGFYEGSPIVYSQYVPHDTAKLIELQGGQKAFVERLNWIMDAGYFDSTNEPSQQIPYMYHYANAPGQSTTRARQVISEFFNTSTNGLPGNDDSGAMGSYVAFYLLGLYPLPGTRETLLSSPYFPRVEFVNPVLNTTTTIVAHGFAGNPENGKGKVFVKSVTINGIKWKSACYLPWDAFERGGSIELELTSDQGVTCGSGSGALPPSLSSGGYS